MDQREKREMKSMKVWVAAILAALLLAACGGGLKGTFEDEMGLTRLTFRGGGKAVQSTPMTGGEVPLRYEVDGNQIRLIHGEAGMAMVLTRIDDDTLSGPMGIRFVRRKK